MKPRRRKIRWTEELGQKFFSSFIFFFFFSGCEKWAEGRYMGLRGGLGWKFYIFIVIFWESYKLVFFCFLFFVLATKFDTFF